jgi:hypothetical protein
MTSRKTYTPQEWETLQLVPLAVSFAGLTPITPSHDWKPQRCPPS